MASIHANFQKTSLLKAGQTLAQTALIDRMALYTLLTGLETRQGVDISSLRAGNTKDLLKAHVRIRREVQHSYFDDTHK